ncbi:hypothetical protein PG994_007720 [Apiospora phragmitis]|uniref:Uncharacterized protein n=1 Tax=Apiospora phragmitis TaxID=2905665 RepID=A0ABR1UU47_9PEZI
MCLGLVCEVLVYAGRITSWKNQWGENGFLMQIICLTIGPAFMAVGVYFRLRIIVCMFGSENSRLKPGMFSCTMGRCGQKEQLLVKYLTKGS